MEGTLRTIAGSFLALFAGIWLYVGWKLYDFDPTVDKPKLVFSSEFASVAGFLAAAVAAGTATVLGIEIQKAQQDRRVGTLASAVGASALLKVGILLYFAIGLLILLLWLGDTDVAPEMVAAFALGALGWMAGAFSAVFQSSGGGGGGGTRS
jgi:hypothetical protein